MNKTISIITVVFNDKDGLERTINSVLTQSYSSLEYIIIDGGSTDGTLNVIKEKQDKISKWISEPDKGIYDAMNKGIKMASSEWLCFMNAGDIFTNECVIEKVFSGDIPKSIDFLYSDIYVLNKKKERIVRKMDFHTGSLIHQCIIYKRKLHDVHGLYVVTPKIIISDFIFFAQIAEERVMKITPIIAVFEGGGVSQQGNWAQQQAYCLDVVFRRRTFWGMVAAYTWKRLKALMPSETKDIIKRQLGLDYKGNGIKSSNY